ncbi:2300_t:CDS:2, partial [Funneliformis geosporum]
EQLCREIVSKYLGPPSKICRSDFLKTLKYYQGLELDIPYYDYDQLKKELCEENQIALRYVWYYEDPYVAIPEHLRELGIIE